MASRRHRRRQDERGRVGRRPRIDHLRADGTAKARFATQADAERAALQARLEHGTALGSYQCATCGGWHLGTRSDEDL